MSILIIHPEDSTTTFLKDVYEFKYGLTIVNSGFGKRKIKDLVDAHSTVIIMGHGTEKGLINPNGQGMIIDSRSVYYLRGKNVIGIWCHANKFFEKYGLKGFSTSMFISDYTEAMYEGVLTEYTEIEESNKRLANGLRELLDCPIELIEDQLREKYTKQDKHEPLYEFNANGFKTFI